MRSVTLALALVVALAQDAPSRGLVHVEGDTVVVESECMLKDVVDTLAPLAKRTVMEMPDVARKLDALRLNLSSPLIVPVARAGEVLEALAFSFDFVFLAPIAEGLPWKLLDVKGADRMSIRASSRLIESSEIDAYARRYVLVSVTIALENVNAREVSASLRPFFPDSGLETVTNVGNANLVLVTGFGPTVASIARLLRQIDRGPSEPGKATPEEITEIDVLKARIASLEKRLAAIPEKPK